MKQAGCNFVILLADTSRRLLLQSLWRQIPPALPTMAEDAGPTKNDVIDLSQRRPERKLVENPITWWGDTPWCMWNFNYGASRAPAP